MDETREKGGGRNVNARHSTLCFHVSYLNAKTTNMKGWSEGPQKIRHIDIRSIIIKDQKSIAML